MRFYKTNNEDERIAVMFFDEFAGVSLEKFWPRQFKRQVANGQFRESSVWFVGRDAF